MATRIVCLPGTASKSSSHSSPQSTRRRLSVTGQGTASDAVDNSLPKLYVYKLLIFPLTASVVLWSEFLAADPEVPGLTPGPTRFSEK
jgi:hypothetical protein